MQFTVTYRGANGALVTEAVEAASRSECFAQMKARGIMPTGVKEGAPARKWKANRGADGSRDKGGEAPKRPSRNYVQGRDKRAVEKKTAAYVIAVACALFVVVGALWWMHTDAPIPENEPDVPKKLGALAKEVKPAVAPKPVATDETLQLAGGTEEQGKEHDKRHSEPPKEELISVVTNKSGYIIERVRNPDGTTTKRVHTPPPVFKHGSDQMIALVLSAPPGQAMPPMPMNAFTDDEFKRSLKEKIEILDTDSDDVKDLKAKVIVARSEIKAMMDKGYSALQVLQEHQDIFNDNAKLHTDALIEMKSILDSGDREEARKYAIAMNAAFQQMGVPELPVPSKDGAAEADSRAETARERIKERIRARKEETR